MTPPINSVSVDELAQEIRRIDGNNEKGAGELAEGVMAFLAARRAANTPVDGVDALEVAGWTDKLLTALAAKAPWDYADHTQARGLLMSFRGILAAAINASPALPSQAVGEEKPVAWRIESKATPGEAWEWIEGREPTEYSGFDDFTATPLYTRPASPVSAEVTERKGIYVASKVAHAQMWKDLRHFEQEPIISTWIDEAGVGESASLQDLWRRCVHEASTAGALIIYRRPDEVLKGAWVELGAALANGVPVFAVGIEEFTVANHAGITHCKNLIEARKLARAALLAALPEREG